MYEDWTLIYEHWTPDAQGHRTQHPSDEDFVAFMTLWDSGLCGIQDFMGFGTLWDSGLHGI